MKKLIVVLSVSFLVGCAATGIKRPVSDQDLAKVKKVAVVSLLGNSFNGIHIGFTVFNNSRYTADVTDWKVDGMVSEQALSMLTTTKRFSVSSLELGSDVAAFYTDRKPDSTAVNYKKLLALAAAGNHDTVVLVRRAQYDNAPFHVGGYGLFDRSGLYVGRCVYSLFVVEVIDVATEAQLAWEWGYPCLHGDEDVIPWKVNFDQYSLEEKRLIRARLEQGIRNSLSRALHKLRLIPGA